MNAPKESPPRIPTIVAEAILPQKLFTKLD